MKKLILFDIDGTLRDEVGGVPPSAVAAIKACAKEGHQLGLCTGRTIGMIHDEVMALDFTTIIAGGGTHVLYAGKTLQDAGIKKTASEALLAYDRNFPGTIGLNFETDDKLYMNALAARILTAANRRKRESLSPSARKMSEAQEKIQVIDNIADFKPEKSKVRKIGLWVRAVNFDHWRREIVSLDVEIAQDSLAGEEAYLELIPKGYNKGHAMERLCRTLNIPKEAIVAFGDGKNDIEMFKAAGLAIAMDSGDREAKSFAHRICEAPLDDGISLELRRQGLIG